MPRAEGYRKWSEEAIRLVPRSLVAFAVGTGTTIISDERPHARPRIFASDESQCPVLSKMAGENVVMLVLKNTYS